MLQIPTKKPYFITDNHQRLLNYIDHRVTAGANTNILVTGPSGCGKSELPTQYAAIRGRQLAVVEVGRLSESTQIFGSKSLREGNIVYKPGLFTQAIQTPNCVIHLQELNRPENDKALNAIFSVLDETFRAVYLDETESLIKVAPGVTFFATINEGYQFIGTMPVDEALENRFAIKMKLGYLPNKIEETILILQGLKDQEVAKQVVKIINGLRYNGQNPMHISTRQSIEVGRLVAFGATLIEAFEAVISPDQKELEQVLLQLHLEDVEVGQIGVPMFGLLR